jgi:hypothetical protein
MQRPVGSRISAHVPLDVEVKLACVRGSLRLAGARQTKPAWNETRNFSEPVAPRQIFRHAVLVATRSAGDMEASDGGSHGRD